MNLYRVRREYFTSSASWLSAAAQTMERHGTNGPGALADAGIHLDAYRGGGQRAPTDVIREAWSIVARETNDPAIGIRAAFEHFDPVEWRSLGLAILCSESIRQALERVVRYFEVVSDAAETGLREDSEYLCFIATTFGDPGEFGYEAIEYGLGALLVLLGEIYPRRLPLFRVDLLRPPERANADFEKLLGCPVKFGCERESIYFPIGVVDERLQGSNEDLASYQDSFSAEYVERFGNDSMAMAVRKELLRSLPGGKPCARSVANALNMSVRHLQRKLQIENSSFSAILTDARKKLAATYLVRPDLELTEIAYLLGYSDHSNFSRAFKTWCSTTPTAFRQSRKPVHA